MPRAIDISKRTTVFNSQNASGPKPAGSLRFCVGTGFPEVCKRGRAKGFNSCSSGRLRNLWTRQGRRSRRSEPLKRIEFNRLLRGRMTQLSFDLERQSLCTAKTTGLIKQDPRQFFLPHKNERCQPAGSAGSRFRHL